MCTKIGHISREEVAPETQEWTDLDYEGEWDKIKAKHNTSIAKYAVWRITINETHRQEVQQLRTQLAATERKYLDMERRYRESERQLDTAREALALLAEKGPLVDYIAIARTALAKIGDKQ